MDLATVPLVEISVGTKQVISMLLNPTKVLPHENGSLKIPRDWRGLAYLLKFSVDDVLLLSRSNPTIHMLTLLKQRQKIITIKDFQTMMEQISRWDIIDDTEDMFEKDAVRYFEEKQRAQISADVMEPNVDKELITRDDLHRVRNGLRIQYYDAFLLYADEDINFVTCIVGKLEREYGLTLCLKDRDLLAGISFEHEAVMEIIHERCNRVLVIISPSFLVSAANKFYLNFAQALSIETQQRKIVPCLYKKCILPKQLKFMCILDYNRKGIYDFWGKLRDSLQALNSSVTCTQNIVEVTDTLADNYSDVPEARREETEQLVNLPSLHNLDVPQTCCEETEQLPNLPSLDNLDILQVSCEEIDVTNMQQKSENCVIKNISDTKASKSRSKKSVIKFLKNKTKRKNKQTTENDQLIMEQLANLPSLDDLDVPQASREEIDVTNTQQEGKNCVIKNITDTQALNSTSKKSKIKLVKITIKQKKKPTMENDQIIMQQLAKLPSLSNLDSLDSFSDVCKKKKKKNLFDMFTKKG